MQLLPKFGKHCVLLLDVLRIDGRIYKINRLTLIKAKQCQSIVYDVAIKKFLQIS